MVPSDPLLNGSGYLTPKATAQLLAVNIKLVYKLAAAGELERLKVGRSVRILATSLRAFIARNTRPQAEVQPAAPATPSPTPPPSPAPRPRRAKGKRSGFLFLPPR
jgi:excisionase family DNA binding protein